MSSASAHLFTYRYVTLTMFELSNAGKKLRQDQSPLFLLGITRNYVHYILIYV